MWFDENDEIFERMFLGNVQPSETGELLAGAREPFTDVIVNDKSGEVVIIAEMPGVAKEDIKIRLCAQGKELLRCPKQK